jgi:hypothetical protein
MFDGEMRWFWAIALALLVYFTHPSGNHHVNPTLSIPPPAAHSTTDVRVVQAFSKMERRGYECSMRPRPAKVIFAYDSGQVAVISFSQAWKDSHSGGGDVMAYCSRP